MAQNYRIEMEFIYEQKYRKLISMFPDYCIPFFNYLRINNEIRSCYSYAEDLKIFFEYLIKQNSQYGGTLKEVKLETLDELVPDDFYEYIAYLTKYTDNNGILRTNSDVTKKHKINTLRVFYNYFYNNRYIENNPLLAVSMKKPNTKEIIVLDNNEIKKLLNYMDELEYKLRICMKQSNCSKSLSQRYHSYRKCKFRDKAIIMVFLGTGIRVSECVGLDISDINFEKKSIHIVRKGGNEDHVFFNDEVANALTDYLDKERPVHEENADDKRILFYSKDDTRMGVRSMEKMIKKYVIEALGRNDVSVHKLRSSFATNGYKETRDAYAISKSLGHSSLSMVGRYAKAGDDDKIRVAESIKLAD